MVLAFLAAVGALALLTLLPGPDFAVVVRWAAAGGRRSGLLATGGVVTGLLVWGVLTVLGLSALLAASPIAYAVVRYLGAAYLVWMAARLLWRSFRESGSPTPAVATSSSPFRQGLLTNLLNPKIAAFYVGVLPLLVPLGAPRALALAALVLCHIVLGLIWLGTVSVLVARGNQVLSRPRVRAWLDRVTAVVLLGFAARLVLDAG
ncbi:MAG TPA: LysE family translocator [Pseudolysinimonas sp.]|jgi:threonine/homoserine/homoserine lactone efflux protein